MTENTSIDEAAPHSSRVENSVQQQYNFGNLESSEVPTPHNESEQIVLEEPKKTDVELEFDKILKDCKTDEINNDASIFNINKAQYEDQLTTHSSITKGAVNEHADVSLKDINMISEHGEKNQVKTNSIDISMEEKTAIDL